MYGMRMQTNTVNYNFTFNFLRKKFFFKLQNFFLPQKSLVTLILIISSISLIFLHTHTHTQTYFTHQFIYFIINRLFFLFLFFNTYI